MCSGKLYCRGCNLFQVHQITICVSRPSWTGDPKGFEPDLAADLRMVVKEGLHADLPDMEMEAAEGDEQDAEEAAAAAK